MTSTSYIELSQQALDKNISFIRQVIGLDPRLTAVIKANAYGHGIEQFVTMAEQTHINHFTVFSAEEAQRVLKSSRMNSDALVMGFMTNEEVEWAVHNQVEFYVFEQDRLRQAVKAAQKWSKKALIHLEIETGMNRTGFRREEFLEIAPYIREHLKELFVKGLCTHYAGAESIINHKRVEAQVERFSEMIVLAEREKIPPEVCHSACSAAALAFPNTVMDLVRSGILCYGYWPSQQTQEHYYSQHPELRDVSLLKPVLQWKSWVMSTKEVKAGDHIGYGESYMADQDMVIASVPVGYGYGYPRDLSNKGEMLIHGKLAPVVGRVGMNATMVDVTHLYNVKKGDEVVIIGEQGDKAIWAAAFPEWENPLNYEVLSRLPESTPRLAVE